MLRMAIWSYLLVMVISVATAAAGQGVARADGPLLHSGDLVVAMEYRDPVTYEYSLRLEVRTAGAPAQVGASVALGGGYPAALASDAAGNVYVYLYEDTAGPSVVKYNRSLEPLGTVGTASHGRAAEGMAVADNGDVFVAAYSDGTSGSGGIYEFSANGQIHGQIIPMQIGAEGVNLGPDQCTLTYYDLDDNNGYGRLRRYDACTHQALPDPVAPLPGLQLGPTSVQWRHFALHRS